MQILNLNFFSKDLESLLKLVDPTQVHSRKLSYIATPNPEQLVQAKQNPDFYRVLQAADVLVVDGWGVQLALQLQKLLGRRRSVPVRYPGRVLVEEFLCATREHDLAALVVGGRGYLHRSISESGSKIVAVDEQVPADAEYVPVFWTPGYEDITAPTREEERAVRSAIKKLKPAIVFVAFGAPHQEQWIVEHRDFLEENSVRVAMAVGGSFDVLVGKLKKPPQWVQDLYLEWLFRLLQEPRRWRRQLRLITFGRYVLQELI